MKASELFLYDLIPNNKEAFATKVINIAALLGCNPHYLMTVMYLESKLNPAAKNPFGSATGLIQFTEDTAKGLGTTTAALKLMSNVQQLDYVYSHLKRFTNKLNSLGALYLAVFYPTAVTKADDYRLALNAKWVNANKIFDVSKDGTITVGEIKTYIGNYFEGLKKKFIAFIQSEPAKKVGSVVVGIGIGLLLINVLK